MKKREMRDKLKESLKKKRYEHSEGVCAEAVRMAELFGADTEKAYIAGLLHDCAKCLSPGSAKAMIASHKSGEPGGERILKELGKNAVIHAGMYLGEGGGALMMYELIKCALGVYQSGHGFEKLGIEPYRKY